MPLLVLSPTTNKMKFINFKFILTSTLTFIPYTALWFFWHNNLFHSLYYSSASFYSMGEQNVWAMNFGNALLVYGFVYFYYRAVKPETRLIQPVMWSVYYNISAVGFYAFMSFGILKDWSRMILIHDLFWAVGAGAVFGALCHIIYGKLHNRHL
jgi:hypothetical protein